MSRSTSWRRLTESLRSNPPPLFPRSTDLHADPRTDQQCTDHAQNADPCNATFEPAFHAPLLLPPASRHLGRACFALVSRATFFRGSLSPETGGPTQIRVVRAERAAGRARNTVLSIKKDRYRVRAANLARRASGANATNSCQRIGVVVEQKGFSGRWVRTKGSSLFKTRRSWAMCGRFPFRRRQMIAPIRAN